MPEFCKRRGGLAHPLIRIVTSSIRALTLAAALITAPAAADPPAKVLVLDLELLDTSGEPVNPDHAGRLERTTALLREGLAASGRYAVTGVRDSAVAAALPASVRLCNGCELDLGRQAGADIVVTGFIHKISTLILNLQIIMRDVRSGDVVAAGNADIRGDNERAWRRGVDWLLRHRLTAGTP